jgi:hypothetical protein
MSLWFSTVRWTKVSLTKAGERATSACSCRRVNVQRCSVQYKGYNLVGVTTVEEGTTIGTTALVNWQLHTSFYTGAVQGYWSTPDWSDHCQRCRQVSTVTLIFNCQRLLAPVWLCTPKYWGVCTFCTVILLGDSPYFALLLIISVSDRGAEVVMSSM